ncbi:hypothetical protein ACLBOM_05735 [Escherichia coli]
MSKNRGIGVDADILTSAINDLLMTLGALLALCKSFSMQKSTVLCAIAAKRVKKQQTEKKNQKNTCAKNWESL